MAFGSRKIAWWRTENCWENQIKPGANWVEINKHEIPVTKLGPDQLIQ